MVGLTDMDLDTGRRQMDLDVRREELRCEREELAKQCFFKIFLHVWC